MAQLQSVSADIRTNGASSEYYSDFAAYAQSGAEVGVTLADGTSTTATLVAARDGLGLVFMLDALPDTAAMNAARSSEGAWSASAMHASLNGGALYEAYFDNGSAKMTMALSDATAQDVVPVSATVYSADYNGGERQEQTSAGNMFFLASFNEVFGSSATESPSYIYGSQYETHTGQFAYFGAQGLDVTGASYAALGSGWSKAGSASWWLRSANTYDDTGFGLVLSDGTPGGEYADSTAAVLPCFCI